MKTKFNFLSNDTIVKNYRCQVKGILVNRFSLIVFLFFYSCLNISAQPTDLFISEYVEGSSNNKYIEIYNGTGAAVNLTDYQLNLYANGSATITTSNTLSGSLANGATIVYKNSAATIYGGAATNATALAFNGDDAIVLFKISTSSFIDIVGNIGCDPGAAWTATNTTVDKTLVRNATLCGGVTVDPTNTACPFPTLATEWTQSNVDVVTNLGSHTCTCASNTITSGALSSPFSVDCTTSASGTIDFTSTGTFAGGNIYTAQLSSSTGSFASPTNIGTLSSTSNMGTINLTIPAQTATSSLYKIRIISSNPVTTGTETAAFTITFSGSPCGGGPTGSSCIVINEFCTDPQDPGANGAATSTGEWVEIRNVCAATVDIGCFVICLTASSTATERAGDCFTVPSGTSLAGGEVFVFGGNGTFGVGTNWPAGNVEFNWQTNFAFGWDTDANAVFGSGSGNFIGVLNDSGEDISLFDATGTFFTGVTHDTGAGMTNPVTENIPALAGCAAKNITIPISSSHTNVGVTPGGFSTDQGFGRRCDGTWEFRNLALQNMGTAPELCVLLPINLNYFDVNCSNENQLYFSWETASEINNDYFIIEKTANGEDFEIITQIKGQGNSSTENKYNFNYNHNRLNNQYFRLSQVEYDGEISSTSLILPSCFSEKNELIIFPNPTNGDFIIKGFDKNAVIAIYDQLGRLVLEQKPITSSLKIDLSLNSDVYILLTFILILKLKLLN